VPRYKGSTRWSLEQDRDGWGIVRRRPWDKQWISIPTDEAEWCINRQRAQALFFWHRNYGLQRREPHPMGKDLDVLTAEWKAEHAERYRSTGMEPPGCYL